MSATHIIISQPVAWQQISQSQWLLRQKLLNYSTVFVYYTHYNLDRLTSNHHLGDHHHRSHVPLIHT